VLGVVAVDTPLGQATTNAEAQYSVSYRLGELGRKSAADLVIRIKTVGSGLEK
jgi:hypothetical protein